MKKIVVINSGNHGSVGNVIWGISRVGENSGYKTYVFCPPGGMQTKGLDNQFIGTVIERRVSDFINNISGRQGSLNYFGTADLIRKIKQINPDIIHLHNLHSNYINLKRFFDFLIESQTPVVWTLHDCWAFTGNCPHYVVKHCDKWKTKCTKCDYKGYPKGLKDIGDVLFENKKKMFCQINCKAIVTPSKWLESEVKESFLKQYPVHVINNGIDLEVFKPCNSNFRERYGIEDKFIVLSVAFGWGYKKGLDRLKWISTKLGNKFQMVIVGADEKTIGIPGSICIPRTNNKAELAEIYGASDVLLNPTREDTFPTVNMEALACGTPVLSYGACGSAEAFDETCGVVVNDNDVLYVLKKLSDENFDRKKCIDRAQLFNAYECYAKYVNLYETL